MARSFQQMYQDVSSYVQKSKNAEAELIAQGYINDGISKLNTYDWDWQYASSGIQLQVGTREYALPADFRTQRGLMRIDVSGNNAGYIAYSEPKIFDRLTARSGGSGNPQNYTVYNPHISGVITLDVSPSAQYISSTPSLDLAYYGKIQELTTSGQMLEIPDQAISVVVWYARASMAAQYGDDTRLQIAEKRWTEGWKALLKEQRNRQLKDWR